MNILIVEDEDVILEDIKDCVARYSKDFKITALNNPLIALEMLDSQMFDIALLDIEMPHIRGIDLAERLYQKQPQLKVAFVTAYNNYATEAFELYAIDYVLKPIREERLTRCLERLVEAANIKRKDDSSDIVIKAFGNLQVWIAGNLVIWKRKKAYETFAYLLANCNKPIRKEKLIDDIFPDFDLERGTVHLQTVISHIRKLGLDVHYFDNAYMYSTEGTKYDVEQFIVYYEIIQKSKAIENIDKAMGMADLYNAAFLEEDGFLWCLPYTIHLENIYIGLLDGLLKQEEVFQNEELFNKLQKKKDDILTEER